MRAIRALFRCCIPNKDNQLDIEEDKKENNKSHMEKNKEIDVISQYRIEIGDEDRETGNNSQKEDSDRDSYREEIDKLYSCDRKGKNKKNKYPADYYKVLFEDRLIRDDERDHITFTKKGLLDLLDSLINLDNYELLYNQNKLLLHCHKSGSMLNKELFLGKSIFTLARSEFKKPITLEYLAKMIYDPEERLKWDTSMKVLKKLEEGDEAYVIRSWMHSPIFMVAEREVVDKRVEFYHDGAYYNISTSAPQDYIPDEENVVRVKTYINALTLTCDNENFYFQNLNQVDFKMPLPQALLNVTLPSKIISWYKTLVEGVNKSLSSDQTID